MSYIDCYVDKKDVLHVVEKVNGKRKFTKHQLIFSFYYTDENGKYTSINGKKLSRRDCKNHYELKEAKKEYADREIFESDLNSTSQTLYEHYRNAPVPELNIGFFDIEVDFDPKIGFANPENPYANINAITLYKTQNDTYYTLGIPPKGLYWEDAQKIARKLGNVKLFKSERELLIEFLNLIEDVDLLSGYNSTFFDCPYIILRISKVLGDEYLKKLCFWNQVPQKKETMKFNKLQTYYDLIGRVHIDYLELYRKYTYSELHSFKLSNVGKMEVGEDKTNYEGTLDQLYNNDFELFLTYNKQDVSILVKLEKKLKFINLINNLAHANCTLFILTLGSVGLIDQSIVNYCHARNLKVFDRKNTKSSGSSCGAYVMNPKKGMHKWVGSTDIKSLYPSILRSLNMSPDTIFGQVRQTLTKPFIEKRAIEFNSVPEAWNDVFAALEYDEIMNQTNTKLIVDIEGKDKPKYMTGKEIYEWIFAEGSNLCISANGTIFRTDVEGIIPGLLAEWYNDRVKMKKTASNYGAMASGVEVSPELMEVLEKHYEKIDTTGRIKDYPAKELAGIIKNGDEGALYEFIKKYDVIYDGKRIIGVDVPYYKAQADYWDMQQLIKKIQLNSLYGSILNEGSRFFDPRIGQSVTLTGRQISKQMAETINEIATGVRDRNGRVVTYGDTDSIFSCSKIIITPISSGNDYLNNYQQCREVSIEDLFKIGTEFQTNGDKEYSFKFPVKSMTFDPATNRPLFKEINYVYRHKVSKEKWEIEDELGNIVIVTGDHSAMVERNNILIECKPRNILKDDVLISIDIDEVVKFNVMRVEHVGNFDDEFVYDIGMQEDTPYFFADNILVHNSCYFSLDPLFNDPESPFSEMEVTKENVATLYDGIAAELNTTFAPFMSKSFHVDLAHGAIIEAERENVAETGLFIKKKRYAILIYDAGGKRVDRDGKPGKIKAMGVETKRSDTPGYIQEFLEGVLMRVLTSVPKHDIISFIRDFRLNTIHKLSNKEPWKLGRPTSCNGLTKYANAIRDAIETNEAGTIMIPSNVRSAMNWNQMIDMNDDQYSGKLTDGSKIVVCDLTNNIYNFKSIARPVDLEENQIPQWFKDLPFAVDDMEQKLIDEKLENLIGILEWDLTRTSGDDTIEEMFDVVVTDIDNIFKKKKKKDKEKKVTEDTSFGDLFS